jgi:deazaflavin-dependent oxidoreductase (nitroreductase family)
MRFLRAFVQRLGHRRAFAALGRLLTPADRLVGRMTRGRLVALGMVPSLLITTTGRRTGARRTNPLVYVRDGDGYGIAGSNWGQTSTPAWALNLLADPLAEVTIGGATHPVRARLAEGEERERLWRLLVGVWPPYETYRERAGEREILIFRLEPRTPEP